MAARGWTTDVKVEEDGFDPARCSDIAKQLVSPVFQKLFFDSSSSSTYVQSLINYASNLQMVFFILSLIVTAPPPPCNVKSLKNSSIFIPSLIVSPTGEGKHGSEA